MDEKKGLEDFKRKQPLNCENKDIKKLFMRCLERTLMDIAESKLALSPSQETAKRKAYLKNTALAFLKSEWCMEMCEYIDFDYWSIRRKGEAIATEYHQNYFKAFEKRKKAKT